MAFYRSRAWLGVRARHLYKSILTRAPLSCSRASAKEQSARDVMLVSGCKEKATWEGQNTTGEGGTLKAEGNDSKRLAESKVGGSKVRKGRKEEGRQGGRKSL